MRRLIASFAVGGSKVCRLAIRQTEPHSASRRSAGGMSLPAGRQVRDPPADAFEPGESGFFDDGL
jgi:hypothetical protein